MTDDYRESVQMIESSSKRSCFLPALRVEIEGLEAEEDLIEGRSVVRVAAPTVSSHGGSDEASSLEDHLTKRCRDHGALPRWPGGTVWAANKINGKQIKKKIILATGSRRTC